MTGNLTNGNKYNRDNEVIILQEGNRIATAPLLGQVHKTCDEAKLFFVVLNTLLLGIRKTCQNEIKITLKDKLIKSHQRRKVYPEKYQHVNDIKNK